MPTRLFLVAHGRTPEAKAVRFPADEPLSDRGLAAARRAAARLPRFDRIFASPARAALETAAALGARAETQPALRDQDFGRWAGRALAEVAEAEPEAFQGWIADPNIGPGGGEPFSAVVARVGAWLDGRHGAAGRTLAVAHPATLRAAIVQVLGALPGAAGAVDIGPLTLAEFASDGRRWTLRRLAPRPDREDETVPIRPDSL